MKNKSNFQPEPGKIHSQIVIVIKAFEEMPATMQMVAEKTNIYRSNICYYIPILKRQNKIAFLYKDKCQVTKHPAGYYTTDFRLFPKSTQLRLF